MPVTAVCQNNFLSGQSFADADYTADIIGSAPGFWNFTYTFVNPADAAAFLALLNQAAAPGNWGQFTWTGIVPGATSVNYGNGDLQVLASTPTTVSFQLRATMGAGVFPCTPPGTDFTINRGLVQPGWAGALIPSAQPSLDFTFWVFQIVNVPLPVPSIQLRGCNDPLLVDCEGIAIPSTNCVRRRRADMDLAIAAGSYVRNIQAVTGTVYTMLVTFTTAANALAYANLMSWLAGGPQTNHALESNTGINLHFDQWMFGGEISNVLLTGGGLTVVYDYDISVLWSPAAPCSTVPSPDFAGSGAGWAFLAAGFAPYPAALPDGPITYEAWDLLPSTVPIVELVGCGIVPPRPSVCPVDSDPDHTALTPSGWRKIDGHLTVINGLFGTFGAGQHRLVAFSPFPPGNVNITVPNGSDCDDGHELIITAVISVKTIVVTGAFVNGVSPITFTGSNAFSTGGRSLVLRWSANANGWVIVSS